MTQHRQTDRERGRGGFSEIDVAGQEKGRRRSGKRSNRDETADRVVGVPYASGAG